MTVARDELPAEVISFLHDTTIDDLPDRVVGLGHRCLLDLLGVAAAGRTTRLSAIVHDHALAHFGPGSKASPMLFDGRMVSPAGAALAAGMTIDSIDAHDGHRLAKGHAGCHQLPALLAFVTAEDRLDPSEFLSSLVVGYEMATRAGIALHETVADYHTSGAWGAVACAALGARVLGLDRGSTFDAMGIAEYHGPRSQMMRVIDHPTMLKDGSGWGAMAGVSAAYLAAEGFTGAPAITVSAPEVAHVWADLGTRWIIEEQYFKPHPVCRWAQPAVEAVLELCRTESVQSSGIEAIEVTTFHEAARLATVLPETTEHAQYSLPFPVAAAAARGRLGASEIGDDALADPEIRALATRVRIGEDPEYNAAFPGERFARVALVLADGRVLRSGTTAARGDHERPLSDGEIRAKYHEFADPVLGGARASTVERAVDDLTAQDSLKPLFDTIFS